MAWSPRFHRAHEVQPVRITTAPEAPGADIAHRQKRYVISMLIRTACFLGAIVVGDNWVRWVLVAGAFFLPYFAVVMANTASPRLPGSDLMGDNERRHHELPGPR